MATPEQIAAEAEELKNALVIIPVVGIIERCHICGDILEHEEAKIFDAHIPGARKRKACGDCNAG